MSGPVGREHSQYRRGLVLGFTVAETILLILFALLLALAMLMAQQARRIQASELESARLTAALAEASEKLVLAETRAEVAEASSGATIPDDFVRELVRGREQAAAAEKFADELRERERALEANERLAQALADSAIGSEVRDLAALGLQMQRQLEGTDATRNPASVAGSLAEADAITSAMAGLSQFQKEGRSTADQLRAAASEMSTLRGQVARLRSELASIGRGGDLPPCWITEVGRVQYLFDVALMSDGRIAVRDTTPPDRQLDRSDLPIPAELFGGPLGVADFRLLTRPLYNHSMARECRFFVRIKDETAPDQKALFKSLLLTVEEHFYKYLIP